LGIVTAGKSYLDVCQALIDLGIDQAMADEMGLTVYKLGMPWPLEPEGIRQFAGDLEEILIIEEKRPLIEDQLKGKLYGLSLKGRPQIIGKFDEHGNKLLPSTGELSPAKIARIIAGRLERFGDYPFLNERVEFLARKEAALEKLTTNLERTPYFCSGCPHNTSTRVPDGSRAMAGIGCHTMAVWRDATTATFTQMGGEGVTWIGQAPFTETSHVFQNLGDGTYFHSGLLAIRAAVAAGVNITYKILCNGAVAMTGGQPMDGELTPASITHQVYGEGVGRIVVVSDEPDKYGKADNFAAGVTIHHRREMARLQGELRTTPGVTILVYDQLCAAEKRRRRKTMPAAPRRVFINEWVCEGCGDCSAVSSCLSVVPLETGLGRKRMINQSNCNMDYSCLDGFCPSFVTVEGGQLKQPAPEPMAEYELPAPDQVDHDGVYSILIGGIGGTGVVTIAALLGTAAHLEDKNIQVLDQTGLAQKFGAVMSHVRIAERTQRIHTARIPAGEANLLLGCDLVVAASKEALGKLDPQSSHTVLDTYEEMTSGFLVQRDFKLPGCDLRDAIRKNTAPGQIHEINATGLASHLLGNSIGANMLLLGVAWQKGLIPLEESSIFRAIEVNGVAVAENIRAFSLGRRAACDPEGLQKLLPGVSAESKSDQSLEVLINLRVEYLCDYQDRAYANRYEQVVREVERVEGECSHDSARPVTEAVVRNLFRLLACKDEYEVARLYTSTPFLTGLQDRMEGDYRIQLHLSPPLLARTDPKTGYPEKIVFGSWMISAMKILARLKFLRGSWLDLFAYSKDRKAERQLLVDYEASIENIIQLMRSGNLPLAMELAAWPDEVHGFGPVKAAAMVQATKHREALMQQD
ncbi:MAG: indolepyruvate ferredoxin oxidoreductase family protein, partial [Gammaproteobacteria bacterium]|nr:indolepyruvate ferredoxin oxidoreductase family protein [Gammaproteobacteria bacterium]